jgi:hypothetical protein
MLVGDTLDNQEWARDAAERGNRRAALLVAGLAALLAICEQQAKHAEIHVQANAILATDSWNQYQAKSTRQLMSQDLSAVLSVLGAPNDPDVSQKRAALAKRFADDAVNFQKDPSDGKEAIATRARRFEQLREEELERSHTFDNAAACLQLGIVLATASAITASRLLIRFAVLLGVGGMVFGLLGLTFPHLGAF